LFTRNLLAIAKFLVTYIILDYSSLILMGRDKSRNLSVIVNVAYRLIITQCE